MEGHGHTDTAHGQGGVRRGHVTCSFSLGVPALPLCGLHLSVPEPSVQDRQADRAPLTSSYCADELVYVNWRAWCLCIVGPAKAAEGE